MSRKPIIRVIGSLNIDFVTFTPRVPEAGETLTATSLAVNAGGKGANQAAACGKAAFTGTDEGQDVTVQMFGAVGKGDPYYEGLLKSTLEESGVDMSGVREIEGSQTGTATILVDEGAGGENRILIVPGANSDGMKDVQVLTAGHKGDDVPEVIVMQGEIPRNTVLELLKTYNQEDKQTQIVFNPAPVYPEGIPLEALRGLAVLVVNETECFLLGKSLKGYLDSDLANKSEDSLGISEFKQFAEAFHTICEIKTVLITLGAKGVFYSTDHGQAQNLVPAVKVEKVVDTTAAGDTFVGYFACALARHMAKGTEAIGFDVASAVQIANQAAAKCVQKAGAMQSIPYGYE